MVLRCNLRKSKEKKREDIKVLKGIRNIFLALRRLFLYVPAKDVMNLRTRIGSFPTEWSKGNEKRDKFSRQGTE